MLGMVLRLSLPPPQSVNCVFLPSGTGVFVVASAIFVPTAEIILTLRHFFVTQVCMYLQVMGGVGGR
jgi:hypothetical protein